MCWRGWGLERGERGAFWPVGLVVLKNWVSEGLCLFFELLSVFCCWLGLAGRVWLRQVADLFYKVSALDDTTRQTDRFMGEVEGGNTR